jgi:hypothetical protein
MVAYAVPLRRSRAFDTWFATIQHLVRRTAWLLQCNAVTPALDKGFVGNSRYGGVA